MLTHEIFEQWLDDYMRPQQQQRSAEKIKDLFTEEATQVETVRTRTDRAN